LLEEGHKRKSHKALGWVWHAPWKLGGFKLDGQRLNVRHDEAFEQHPVQMLELFRVAQINDLDIHPHALQLIARNLKYIDDDVRRDDKANALFLDILLAKEGVEMTLRRMSEAGVLGKFIPDFGRVVGQTQFNMYHVYTVDEHTLVALGILHATETGKVKEELPLASDIIHRVRMRRVLYLALFCHDIAKGRGGDHSELGEKIAARLAARMGFSADEIETTAWLVRHHLLFSNTAFKRDINDPKTIQDFVAQVQSPERLKLLLVLTAADIRAVGPAVWNAWKGALLRDLYGHAERSMGAGDSALKQHESGFLREELARRMNGWSAGDVDAYFEQGNASFWASFDLSRHAVIARMMKEAARMELPLLMDTQHDYKRSATEITICTYDQHGLFCKLAGAMALSGANIINAKVFTLKNGMAVDVMQVQDAMGKAFDRPDRLAKMAVYIEQALSGELNLAEAFSRSVPEYRKASRHAVPLPSHVFIDNNASNIYSVIEINGRDRTGFLYDVTLAIAGLGLTIATAHISTYGAQAADVFYVKDAFGMKIAHDSKHKQVREALLRAINRE
jgi:[protein-PII] uridylyltransferase